MRSGDGYFAALRQLFEETFHHHPLGDQFRSGLRLRGYGLTRIAAYGRCSEGLHQAVPQGERFVAQANKAV